MDLQDQMRNAPYIREFQYTWPFYLPMEQFVRISTAFPEVEDRYWISNFGKVYDEKIQGLMKPIIQPNGYWTVTLQRKKGTYTNHSQHSMPYYIHKMVCTIFVGPKPGDKYQVNHKNSIRDYNYEDNLEWTTSKENVRHSFINGNRGIGEDSNHSIYSEATVRHICSLLQAGVTNIATICDEVFHDTPKQTYKTLIYNIRSRKFWTSVSCEYTFDDVEPKKRLFTDEQVHQICQFFVAHPELKNQRNGVTRIVANSIGLDLNNMSPTDAAMYKTAINNIKNKISYKYITSQYNF